MYWFSYLIPLRFESAGWERKNGKYVLELTYYSVCPSVDRSIGRSVDWSVVRSVSRPVCRNLIKIHNSVSIEFHFPKHCNQDIPVTIKDQSCSYRSICFQTILHLLCQTILHFAHQHLAAIGSLENGQPIKCTLALLWELWRSREAKAPEVWIAEDCKNKQFF